MAAEVESGVFNIERGVPWHGLGTPNEGFFIASELLHAAGLDWEVEKVPLFAEDIGAPVYDMVYDVVPDHFGIQRSDGKVLGVVGNRYLPAQNTEVLSFMDNIIGSGQAVYDTAWSLRGGKTVAITAELNQTGSLPLDEGIRTFITAANNHDGSGKIRLMVTPVRVVCMNTLAMATKSAKVTWERKHTLNALSEDAINEAREALKLATVYQQWIEDTAAELMVQAFPKDSFLKLAASLLIEDAEAITKQEANKVDELAALYVNSPNLANIRGTKWGALNAVVEYVDYNGRYRKTGSEVLDKRAESLMSGRGVAVKTHALELLQAA